MPTSISVELVPRDASTLLLEAEVVSLYAQVTHINIPDLMHRSGFTPLRSVEAIELIKHRFGDRFIYVPHIRAWSGAFQENVQVEDIALVVGGDKPAQYYAKQEDTSISRIKHLAQKMPVMAALDPYRSSLKEELAYMTKKRAAGAQGFFTQPFFSLTHARYWDSLIPHDVEVFYGISPVTTLSSIKYWQEKNHAVFPSKFVPTEAGQIKLARSILDFAEKRGRSAYVMPIRMPLAPYLKKVFA